MKMELGLRTYCRKSPGHWYCEDGKFLTREAQDFLEETYLHIEGVQGMGHAVVNTIRHGFRR
jgi:hypothetical protein